MNGKHACLLLTFFLTCAAASVAGATGERNGGVKVIPPEQRPEGRSYGAWAAAWWQWALETPSPPNAMASATSANCEAGQRGKVWFLGGNLLGTDPVERSCSVPEGTSLFFPLANEFYGAFTTDPRSQKTKSYLRQQTCDPAPSDRLSLEIDGTAIPGVRRWFEESPVFAIDLPVDNLFGATAADIPGLVLRPSVDAGYYVFLAPLPVGRHVIRWHARTGCSDQDVTYRLTVVDRGP
jgi:hypothetical protein